MYTYHKETFEEVVDDIQGLIQNHWEEIALNREKVELLPDYGGYRKLMEMDLLQAYTVRRDGILIAYMFVVVSPHLHYSSTIFATNDILYVDQKYRKTMVAFRLFRFVEKELKAKGVHVFNVNMKTLHPFCNFVEGLGFKHIENIYSKYIGD